ncbi:MAG: SGNH/GDSL hydrolase family protein [Chloroflexota bacterium]|nr:MAG: SGNH/GDSL hydrolase family protein [Chloroflexota bacterium]
MTMRYLALGDSYTIGESVAEGERFPMQLAAQLRARGYELDDVGIVARTGWTTDELARALDLFEQQRAAEASETYELVTLLIGVNNQYRGRDVEAYRSEFVKLLQRAIGYAGNRPARVIVVSIPDWGVTPFGKNRDDVAREIDAFNAVNRAETLRLGAPYADITPISRAALHDSALIAADGLHPSAKMYAQWVELILPIAAEILHHS